jgi:RNA polymerase sigma factor (sigma-70 family)
MTRAARPGPDDEELDDAWKAALAGDRQALQKAVKPYLGELLRAARREVRYRVALGYFERDDPTAEELVGEVLVRAWQKRDDWQPTLPLRVWLLALLYRVAHDLSRREARRKRITVSLDDPVPTVPDHEVWDWYDPDAMTRWEDVVEAYTMTPEDEAVADEALTRALDPRSREIFLLCELRRVPISEAALALGISVDEAARLLEQARRRIGLSEDKNLI